MGTYGLVLRAVSEGETSASRHGLKNDSKSLSVCFDLPWMTDGRGLHFPWLIYWFHWARQAKSSPAEVFESISNSIWTQVCSWDWVTYASLKPGLLCRWWPQLHGWNACAVTGDVYYISPSGAKGDFYRLCDWMNAIGFIVLYAESRQCTLEFLHSLIIKNQCVL